MVEARMATGPSKKGGDTRNGQGFGNADKPKTAVGGLVGKLLQGADQERFLAWASQRPRLAALLATKDPEPGDEAEVKLAIEAFRKEATETAIVAAKAPQLARDLEMDEETVRDYLDVYSPAQVEAIALAAITADLDPESTLAVDLELMEDGCFGDRLRQSLMVARVHQELAALLKRVMEEHIADMEQAAAAATSDAAWKRISDRHMALVITEENPDGKYGSDDEAESAAAQEYVQFQERLLAPDSITEGVDIRTLPPSSVVELFKLFNYDMDDLEMFLKYALETLGANMVPRDGEIIELMFSLTLPDFVVDNAKSLVLNERSYLYDGLNMLQMQEVARLHIEPEPEQDEN